MINVLGLSIGISASLVIFLIVQHEFNYENSWSDKDRIFRVVSNMHFPDQDFKNSGVPGPLPNAMRKEIPGIQQSAYFWAGDEYKVNLPATSSKPVVFRKQQHIILADDEYFKLFPYRWIAGAPGNALNNPYKVVLTESRAKLYFPDKNVSNALGQTIIYNDTVKAMVSGVVADLDEVTDFTFKEFISLSTYANQLKENGGEEWGSVNSASQFFVKLAPGVDAKKIDKQLPAFRKAHTKGNDYLTTEHFLQPLRDIHFNHDFDNFDQRLGHKPTLYGLLAVAVFLLLLGCINFINLSTAQAAQRAKEIGIRKTMGSSRPHLILQFLSETLLMTIIATVVSVALTPWILKIFSDYIPEGLHFDLSKQPFLYIFIPVLIILVSFSSGFYPALVLSKYQPVVVLKNVAYASTSVSRKAWVRKSLTVSQFVIAQFFIIATVVVGKQIRFTLNKDLGFRKDAIITFRAPFNYENPDNKQFVLQQKLKSIPEIEEMSLAGAPPAAQGTSIQTMKFQKDGKDIETSVEVKQADTNYLKLYHIKLLAGRNLLQSDTLREYLVNEAYTRFLGYKHPEDILGKGVTHGSSEIPIVGVVADVHTKSLHQSIHPVAFCCRAKSQSTFHVAFRPGNKNNEWKSAITKIASAWREIYPEEEFKYEFFDETIAKFYKKEQDTARLLNWCTCLSILISCLGLLGLVIYTTTQKTKEIGIRKVLGATATQIVSLISKDFMQLVLLAFVIAIPLAYMAMHTWLENFAYRTAISWWVFVVSGLLMFLVALLILGIQTIRAAMANPVKSLRTE